MPYRQGPTRTAALILAVIAPLQCPGCAFTESITVCNHTSAVLNVQVALPYPFYEWNTGRCGAFEVWILPGDCWDSREAETYDETVLSLLRPNGPALIRARTMAGTDWYVFTAQVPEEVHSVMELSISRSLELSARAWDVRGNPVDVGLSQDDLWFGR